jgi:serine phosphatase RsbU (regulator of sigma subunit)
MKSEQILRVVVASPGDVQVERDTVSSIVQELNKSICADRGLHLEAVRWETDTYPGFHPDGPQGIIDPILRIEDCDLLVGIFWKRFGSPTKNSESGTAHEFQLAYHSWKRKRSPQVMMYFKQKPYTPQSKEETDQWGQVLEFRKAFPKEGLWWPYKGTSTFADTFRTHLTNFIRDKFPIDAKGSVTPSVAAHNPDLPEKYYFGAQSRLIEEYTRTFVGRVGAKRELQEFQESHERGYFVVRGAPGQGKTAFSCQLVKEGGYIHHFISRTGGRTDPRLILRSLLAQLLTRYSAADDTIPVSLPDLTKMFEEYLGIATENRRKIVIVIDALDELPTNLADDPPYLVFETLPKGAFFVVTTRPGDRLDRLLGRLYAIPQCVFELDALSLSETEEVMRLTKPNISLIDVERVAQASQGNPLYVRAVVSQLQLNPSYDLLTLPPNVEGFFRGATSGLVTGGNAILGDVLGLLSVARTSLSIDQLGQIMGRQQREIFEQGIRPIRQFLLEIDGAYAFYHARFHEFVTRTMLYDDELRRSHRLVVDWLQRPENEHHEYRFASLAYHLFEAGDNEALTRCVDEQFLAEKARRLGYTVLEDVELWTRALLQIEDPALVKRCVSLVEHLTQILGGDILSDATKALHPYHGGPESRRTHLFESSNHSIPGLDVYVGVLPKAEVSADFFEVIPIDKRLVVAIGDAPSIGLKSAFAARFVANLFHKLIERSKTVHISEILAKLSLTIQGYEYFERISVQCAEIDPINGILRIANAGHPYPVHYSARRRKCDILPLPGDLLNNQADESAASEKYEEYALKVGSGDMFVLLTDGLTEDHVMGGDPYAYRFTEIIESGAEKGAHAIGRAVLDGWRAHPRAEDAGDDVSIIVVSIT